MQDSVVPPAPCSPENTPMPTVAVTHFGIQLAISPVMESERMLVDLLSNIRTPADGFP